MDIYETFNARYLNYEEVAKSFIINEQFNELLHPCHSILMGPRGCGKTTLLKMLTPQSIAEWNKGRANGERKISVPFIAIYIPSDKQWEKQLKILLQLFPSALTVADSVSRGLLNLNVQIAFINMFTDFSHQSKGADAFEHNLSKDIIEAWALGKNILPSFYSIKIELKKRVRDINNAVNRAKDSSARFDTNPLTLPDYCYDDFMDLIEVACDAFESQNLKFQFVGEEIKWAICFDELEIAPKWLQEDLIRNKLRSSPQRFLFKLTTSPIVDVILDLESSPAPGSDYNIIPNWNYNSNREKEWEDFSMKLLSSKFEKHFNESLQLDKVFGKWDYERAIYPEIAKKYQASEISSRYKHEWEQKTIMWYVIKELVKIDNSFRSFLEAQKIDPNDPTPISPSMINEIHRKIKPLIIFRYYYRGAVRGRPRKRNYLFHGLEFIFKFSDGNPRTLINLVNEFFPYVDYDNPEKTKIPIGLQASIFEKLSQKKLNDIKNYPNANLKTSAGTINLADLLERVGTYFFERQIRDHFRMDAVGSFVIDQNVNAKLIELLKLALELGVIQDVNGDNQTLKTSLVGNQFRFSYALYPILGIPPRDENGISLSKILASSFKKDLQLSLNMDYGDKDSEAN